MPCNFLVSPFNSIYFQLFEFIIRMQSSIIYIVYFLRERKYCNVVKKSPSCIKCRINNFRNKTDKKKICSFITYKDLHIYGGLNEDGPCMLMLV